MSTPTEEQLRLAWPHFYRRRSCPDSIAAALAHPLWGPCLRNAAASMHRGGVGVPSGAISTAASRLGRATWVPPTQTQPPTNEPLRRTTAPRAAPRAASRAALRPQRLGAHDAKRAAANDCNDTDDSAIQPEASAA